MSQEDILGTAAQVTGTFTTLLLALPLYRLLLAGLVL